MERDLAGGLPRTRVVVGTDLASIPAIAASIERFGDRYLRRVFTDAEIEDCVGAPELRAARLASRFAVKEAVIKVLRPTDEAIDWRSIETIEGEGGACSVRLSGGARRLAQRSALGELSVSMTRQRDLTAAVVVGVRTDME